MRTSGPRVMPWASLATILFGIGLGVGCSDGTSAGGDLYLRFRANGTLVEYTDQVSLLATFSQTGNLHNAVLTGFDAASNINLQISSDAPVQAGTYAGYTAVNNLLVGAIIGYHDASGTLYTQASNAAADASVTISELTDTNVRGTFTGRLSATGQPDLVITQGEFLLRRFN